MYTMFKAKTGRIEPVSSCNNTKIVYYDPMPKVHFIHEPEE